MHPPRARVHASACPVPYAASRTLNSDGTDEPSWAQQNRQFPHLSDSPQAWQIPSGMILSDAELESLVNLQHRSPHQLLGMHPLGDGTGVVVRAFVPDAATVEALPVHEKDKPKIKLQRIHDSG